MTFPVRKGIIMAAGEGTRLYPLTRCDDIARICRIVRTALDHPAAVRRALGGSAPPVQ